MNESLTKEAFLRKPKSQNKLQRRERGRMFLIFHFSYSFYHIFLNESKMIWEKKETQRKS